MNTFCRYFFPVLLLFCACRLTAQGEVALLNLDAARSTESAKNNTREILRFPFQLERNLIWVEAAIENRPGYFILDTGAPTLLINDRGDQRGKQKIGQGSGGEVALAKHSVNSFKLGGAEQGAQSAYRIDLRGMEERSGREINGMVGHDQLEQYELFIDYPAREIGLLPTRKNELHRNNSPRFTLKFEYVDHLPVVTLRQGKQSLRFAIDTGAGSNLLHHTASASRPEGLQFTNQAMNIRGLDGQSVNHKTATLEALELNDRDISTTEFVLLDLSHLQSTTGKSIDGILGTAFLKDYRISIDYRKRKLHFW